MIQGNKIAPINSSVTTPVVVVHEEVDPQASLIQPVGTSMKKSLNKGNSQSFIDEDEDDEEYQDPMKKGAEIIRIIHEQ